MIILRTCRPGAAFLLRHQRPSVPGVGGDGARRF